MFRATGTCAIILVAAPPKCPEPEVRRPLAASWIANFGFKRDTRIPLGQRKGRSSGAHPRSVREMPMVVTLTAIPDIPMVRQRDDLAGLLILACQQNAVAQAEGDILVVAQKIVSKAEGRYIDLATVRPSARALHLATEVHK